MKKISTVQVFGNEIFKEREIAGRSTVLWMKQAKLFWNRNCRRRRKR